MITEEKIKLSIQNELASLWAEYTAQKTVIVNEKSNVRISDENFKRSKELFQMGQISALDFRQAQLNLVRTQLNLLNATYNAKTMELQLKRYAGWLIE